MDCFQYRDRELFCEAVPVSRIAQEVGTPCYIYSKATFETHYNDLYEAFKEVKPILCYSIKSCANQAVLKVLADQGSGMDVVSGGELYRAMQTGVDPKKIVYAGVGKTDDEIAQALKVGIGWFNIESEEEFDNIASVAQSLDIQGCAALRVNPDVADSQTHVKTATGAKETKFGVDIERAVRFFEERGQDSHLKLDALHLHIGSPIYSPEPYVRALEKALELVARLRDLGHEVKTLDLGGGFAADYETGASPAWSAYAQALVPLLRPFVEQGGQIIFEPGRTISANAGILLSQVLYRKKGGNKQFVIVDSGMHHMIRPTLYESWMFAWPAKVDDCQFVPEARLREMNMKGLETVEVVGPVCESGDYLAKDRDLPPLKRGDLLALFGAGAYGMVMASNYNTQPRPAEVMVDGDSFKVVRRRETYEDILALER